MEEKTLRDVCERARHLLEPGSQSPAIANLITAADALAKTKGHEHWCQFRGCTCGAVDLTKAALEAYWRARRACK